MSVIIRLQLLPLSAAAADIRAFFNGLRIPEGSVHIVGGPEGDAFIGFASDEDARQAMRRDRGQIHGVEIKLYLSSRTEMNEVITEARQGLRVAKSSPAPLETKVESAPTWNSNENVAPIPTNQPVYTQPAPAPAPSPFVPDTSDYNKPAYMRMPEPVQQSQNIEQPYNGIRPPSRGYQGNFASPPEMQSAPRQFHACPSSMQSRNHGAAPPSFFNKALPAEKPLLPTPQFRQQAVPDAHDPKLAEILAKIPAHLRPPHGIPPPHLRHLFPGLGAPSMPPKSGSKPDQMSAIPNSAPERQPLRNGIFTNQPSTSLPVKNESWRDTAPTTNGPFRNESAWNNNSNGPSTGRKPLMNNPSIGRPPISNGNLPTKTCQYFELSRLPHEMLRPSVLEEFIRPSVPLTLSSVKVVYDRSGILLHTLLRLESELDAANLMRKDGQHGIKIRSSSADVFNTAVDGPVAPPPNTGVDSGRRNDRDRERDRERRETRQRSPSRRRRSRSPARSQRQRTRSRSRERSYRSSRDSREKDSQRRSPSDRKGRQEPNRWCLQLTNVPFRGSEEQINEWLSQRVTPAKILRTFYSDGNASDRWIVEFENEQQMEKAFEIRELLSGRTIKLKYITNDEADEYLAIEDIYGKTRQKDSELNQMAELQMQHLNGAMPQPPNFYPAPPIRGRGAPPFFPPGRGRGGPPPGHPYHMPPFMPPQPLFRGGPRGRGFGPPGGMPRGGPHRPPFGGFRGRGYHNNAAPYTQRPPSSVGSHEDLVICEKAIENEEVAKKPIEDDEEPIIELPEYPDDLLSIIGPHGCVIVCNGFPPDITLQEVVNFFDGFDVNEGSIRIKMGDDGVATGECMLAASSPEVALKAVAGLNGKKLREHKVSMKAPQ